MNDANAALSADTLLEDWSRWRGKKKKIEDSLPNTTLSQGLAKDPAVCDEQQSSCPFALIEHRLRMPYHAVVQ